MDISLTNPAVQELRALHFYMAPNRLQKGYFTNDGHLAIQKIPGGWHWIDRILAIVKRWWNEKNFSSREQEAEYLLQWGLRTLPKAIDVLSIQDKTNFSFQVELLHLRSGINDIQNAINEKKYDFCPPEIHRKLSDLAQQSVKKINDIFLTAFITTLPEQTERFVESHQDDSTEELAQSQFLLLANQVSLNHSGSENWIRYAAMHICTFNRAIHRCFSSGLEDLESTLFTTETCLLNFPKGAEILRQTAAEMRVSLQIDCQPTKLAAL